MTVLPIVGRELAVASRRAATYRLRFWVAAGAVAVFFVPLLNRSNSVTQMGRGIFIFLSGAMLCFSMLSGVFLTADSLSAEKREGTLGLLFLTDLNGYDVVLGKLAANSLQAFFGLLAVFPVLGLPLLTGGLSGGEFWRTILVVTVTIYLSLTVGMLVSAASYDGRRAMAGALAAMAILAAVPPLLWQLQARTLGSGFLNCLLWPSPLCAYQMGFDASYLKGSGPWRFWGAIATLFLLANAALFAACILLPRSWQKHSGTDLNTEPRKFEFISEAKPWRRPALGDGKPFVWLALGNLTGQSAMRRMLVLIGPLWAVSLVFLLDHNHNFPFAIVLAFALHFAAKILIAAESGRRLYQDRQSGALELLLVTPLSDREIVAGQREALWKQYRRALWVVTVVNAVTFVVYVMGIIGDSWDFFESEEIVGALLVFLSSVTLLWLDASALIWLGMWRGLNGRKYPRSVLATLGQVMLPPWLLSVLFAVISFASANRAESVFVLIVLWFGVGVAIDVPTIRVARESLGRSFRSVVSGGSGG